MEAPEEQSPTKNYLSDIKQHIDKLNPRKLRANHKDASIKNKFATYIAPLYKQINSLPDNNAQKAEQAQQLKELLDTVSDNKKSADDKQRVLTRDPTFISPPKRWKYAVFSFLAFAVVFILVGSISFAAMHTLGQTIIGGAPTEFVKVLALLAREMGAWFTGLPKTPDFIHLISYMSAGYAAYRAARSVYHTYQNAKTRAQIIIQMAEPSPTDSALKKIEDHITTLNPQGIADDAENLSLPMQFSHQISKLYELIQNSPEDLHKEIQAENLQKVLDIVLDPEKRVEEKLDILKKYEALVSSPKGWVRARPFVYSVIKFATIFILVGSLSVTVLQLMGAMLALDAYLFLQILVEMPQTMETWFTNPHDFFDMIMHIITGLVTYKFGGLSPYHTYQQTEAHTKAMRDNDTQEPTQTLIQYALGENSASLFSQLGQIPNPQPTVTPQPSAPGDPPPNPQLTTTPQPTTN